MSHFITNKHHTYDGDSAKRSLVDTVYTGEGIEAKLTKRVVNCSAAEHKERQSISGYENIFAHVLDSHLGALSQLDVTREWGGLAAEVNTLARDIDGYGTNYDVLLNRTASRLLLDNEVWCFVNGKDTYGNASIIEFPADIVINWNLDRTQVVVRTKAKGTADLKTGSVQETEQYTLFTLEGAETFTRTGESISKGSYTEFTNPYVNISGKPCLPIFKVSSPVSRYVQYTLAQNALKIYDAESSLDFGLHQNNFGFLYWPAEDEVFKKVVDSWKKGNRVFQGEMNYTPTYVHPELNNAKQKMERIRERKEGFYRTAFQSLERSAKMYQTATSEAVERQDSKSAYLAAVASCMEEMETTALHLLAQVYYPNTPSKWNVSVEYPKEFDIPTIEVIQRGENAQKDTDNETN